MTYLVRFLPLAGTQYWVLGVVGAQNDFLGGLIEARTRLLGAALLVMAIILAGGALTLRAVQHGLKRVVRVTAKMREFDFAPTPAIAPFRDLRSVMESLEQAKTAMRAMGKYVPIDLVRDLYEMNHERGAGVLFERRHQRDSRLRRNHRQIHRRQRHDPVERPAPVRRSSHEGVRRGTGLPRCDGEAIRVGAMAGPGPLGHALRPASRSRHGRPLRLARSS